MALERTKSGWLLRLRHGEHRGRFRMPEMPQAAAEARAARLTRMRDRLVGCGLADAAGDFLIEAAAGTDEELARVEAHVESQCAEREAVKPKGIKTFHDMCVEWTSGKMHERFPSRVPALGQERTDQAATRLAYICRTIGHIPLPKLTKADCERALSAMPKGLRPSTLSEYARLIPRVLSLAVLGGHLERSPLPPKWAPGRGIRREFQLLYPKEDAALLDCIRRESFERALLWGFLPRTLVRISEALRLTFGDIDFETGTVTIRKTKIKRMRRFRLEDDVLRALKAHRDKTGAGASERIWPYRRAGIAKRLREDLAKCELTRRELHESTDESRNLTVHDMRASGITIWLAAGKPIPWVMRRSGHLRASRIDTYMRHVEDSKEHDLGVYGPLDVLLDVGQARAKAGKKGRKMQSESSASPTGPRSLPASRGDKDAEPEDRAVPEMGAGPVELPQSGPERTKGAEGAGTGEEASPSRSGPSAPEDLVEQALALALEAAVKAGRLDLVPGIVAELGERRRAREGARGVASLDQHRAKKGEGK